MDSNNNTNSIRLDSIEEAIADIRDGKIIIVVDEDRENEGDFLCCRKDNSNG